jgi:hypothetical protein
MGFYPYIPEGLIPVPLAPPALGNTGITEWINVSEAQMVWLDCFMTVAGATITQCVPAKAYAAAGTGTAVLGFNTPIWAGYAAAGAALTLTRQTDAANYSAAAAAGVHRVIFMIDPAALGKEASTPSLGPYNYLSIGMAGEAADYQSCTCWVLPRYQSDEIVTTRWIA